MRRGLKLALYAIIAGAVVLSTALCYKTRVEAYSESFMILEDDELNLLITLDNNNIYDSLFQLSVYDDMYQEENVRITYDPLESLTIVERLTIDEGEYYDTYPGIQSIFVMKMNYNSEYRLFVGIFYFNANYEAVSTIVFEKTAGIYDDLNAYYTGALGNVIYYPGYSGYYHIDYLAPVMLKNWLEAMSGYKNQYFTPYMDIILRRYQEGYKIGKLEGLDEGYQEGYEAGYTDLEEAHPFQWITLMGEGVGSILSMQVFPHITIGILILIPIVFGLIIMIIKMFIH